ncbi:hypothetical protein J14TS2_12810 [Bacillus sp. J14TS2]|uniref:hypothetical protein n=1 Tax=unclassified Bacillus (in: firmicutes) TaxID=185979 RepID=UPI001A962E26|nr:MULTISPECIES: hypothetical protein [unclassified Bacillus (in: firmicutes)]MBO0992187.1 hypothetical protein [Bacillus sp. SD088]GIN70806.1 hypothetical protein J14TS2_12810 [Bacillus sp. J14TS2]
MSHEHEKKPKEIHVENLVIHAKNVEIKEEGQGKPPHHRDPWNFFWGRNQEEAVEEHSEDKKE